MTTGIKLDQETKDRLKTLGEIRDRSPHWLMKKAIEEYLDREEAFEAGLAEDRRRYEEYVETGVYVSQDDMLDWLEGLAAEARAKVDERDSETV